MYITFFIHLLELKVIINFKNYYFMSNSIFLQNIKIIILKPFATGGERVANGLDKSGLLKITLCFFFLSGFGMSASSLSSSSVG
jgi:hypothetical protein